VDGASAFDLDATFVCRDGKGATGFKLKCTALLSILKKNEGLAKDIRAAFDALVVKENGKQVVTHGSIEPLALLGPLVRVRDGRKQLTALLQPFVNNPVGGVASAVPGGQGMPIPFGAPGDKTPREWIAELRGDDPGRVQEARKALIRFGKWSVPELTAVLRDSEAKGRPAVAAMLGELGALAESATADLVLTLKAEDEALRTASVEALGKIGARGAYDAMLPALDDISPAVRQAAAQALEKLGPPTIAEVGALGEALQKHGPASRAYAVTALEHIGAMTDTSNLLIVALKDKDAAVRKPAAEALGKFGRGAGSAAVPALREALRDSDGGVRQAALDAIQAMGSPPPSALADLRAALKENTAEARRYGAFGLGRLSADARDAVPDLAATLRDTDAGVRAAACAALGRIGAPAKSAAAGIAQALHDPIRSVRLQAGQALGKIGHADGSVAALIEALKEDDDGVSRAADEALKKLSPVDKADLPPLLAALKSDKIKLRLYAAGELVNLGPDAKGAVPGLIAALADRDIELRKRAALALAAIGPDAKSAVDPLTRMLKEGGDPEQRKCAAQALGAIGPEAKSAIPALSKALSDRDAGVRRASAAAMAKLGSAGKAAVPALVLALTDRDIQDDVVGALAKIGKEAVPGLTDALTDRNATMRLGAAAALGEIGPDAKSAIGRLAQLFANDRNRDVRQAAGLALKKIQRKK
jgi:HEAT repeat protein